MDFILTWFFPGGIKTSEAILLLIGFIGQGLFSARFLIQWVVSEKKKENLLEFWIFRCQNLSNFTKMCQNVSKCVKMSARKRMYDLLDLTKNFYNEHRGTERGIQREIQASAQGSR